MQRAGKSERKIGCKYQVQLSFLMQYHGIMRLFFSLQDGPKK